MKIALSSYSGYGAWFILKLLSEGHSVDYFLSKPEYAGVLEGIIPRAKNISLDHRRAEVGFPAYEKYDLSIFDLTGRKRQADFSIDRCPTIGDGSFHCILEDDRCAGIRLMEEAGVNVPPYKEFSDIGAARSYVKKTGKRYVFKPDGGQDQDTATTYVAKDAEDLLEYFDKLSSMSKGAKFILQEFIPGIECSTEGWFNGEDFYLLNCTIEEKKFMNDNKGPNTGCAGNLVFTLNEHSRIYKEGLMKCKEVLKQAGFRGMVDLNTILTETDLYGLEWTPRFGYDASATLACMYGGNYGELLYQIASGGVPDQSWKAEFGVAARLSIAPYPTEIKHKNLAGTPLKGLDHEDLDALLKTYMYDVRLNGKGLECAGINGFMAVPMEIGTDIPGAWAKLDSKIERFQIPDMQYRTDLQKSTSKRYYEVSRMGWL